MRVKLHHVPQIEVDSREVGDHIVFLMLGRIESFLLPNKMRTPLQDLDAMSVAGVRVVDLQTNPSCGNCGAPLDGSPHIALDERRMLLEIADESGEPLENDTENLWDIHQAAAYLNCAEDSVYRLVASGRVPALRLNRRLRFSPAALRNAMNTSPVPQPAEGAD